MRADRVNFRDLPCNPRHPALHEERFRRVDMIALPAGSDETLLVCEQGRREFVSRVDLELFRGCTRFATLEAHADALARRPGVPPGSRELFRRRLEELAARGLLDRASLIARGGSTSAGVPPSIRTVTIPTRDRPETVTRAVHSVVQAAQRSGRMIDCVVIDDSRDGLRLPTFDTVQVVVVGRPERERLAAVLAAESGVPVEVVRRAVLGDAVHDRRVGAAYNVALLLASGQAFLSIDDDAVLRCVPSPALKPLPVSDSESPGAHLSGHGQPEPGVGATSVHDPTAFWFFRDRAAALAIPPLDIDPFAALERVLGRPAAAVLPDNPQAPWVDDVAPPLAHALGSGAAHVAATSFGVLGDSGMGGVRYYLHLRGDSLRRATPDDATWAWVRTTRAVLRATDRVVLSGGVHFMAGAMGLDHRGFLPPFPPSGRGADARFAQLLRRCRDDALIAHLPWALFHDPPEERTEPVAPPGRICLLDPLAWVVQLRSFGPSVPPEDRLRALGAMLEEYGRLPASAFQEFVRMSFWQRCSSEIVRLQAQLALAPTPAFAADLRRDIVALRTRLLDDAVPVPAELNGCPWADALAAIQGYLVRFGELLSAWPALVAATRRLPLLTMIAR